MTELLRSAGAPPVRMVHLGLGNFFRQFLPLATGPLPDAARLVLKALDPELGADEAVVAAVIAGAPELGQP